MADIYYAVAHRPQAEIDSFKTRYEVFPETEIPEIFLKALNLTVIEQRRSSSWGSSHVIYFVKTKERPDELVLRANLGVSSPEVVMQTEKLVTDKVLSHGLVTNKVLAVDISRKDFTFDFQIQEKLPGEDIEANFKGTQAEYDQISFDLGAYIAQYHQLAFPGFGQFDEIAVQSGELKGRKSTFYEYVTTCLEDDLQKLHEFEVLSSAQVKKVITIFEDHQALINSAPGVLVHHDLADHNIFAVNNQFLAAFDWEACVVGDPVLDLASCPTWRTHYPREQRLLAGYQSIAPLPENFIAKKDLYVLRTMLWKIVYATRMGILNEQRKEKFYSALKPFKI